MNTMKLRYTIGLCSILLMSTLTSFKPDPTPLQSRVKWYTFEEAVQLSQANPKKLFIDVYTDWCGWCKRMDKDTFNDSVTAAYLNANFYPVKLNAEQKEAIKFAGKDFQFKTEYKANELAMSLLQGQMSYPSVVFLDEKFNLLTVVPGYQTPDGFKPILKYFGENIYLTKKWDEYQKGN